MVKLVLLSKGKIQKDANLEVVPLAPKMGKRQEAHQSCSWQKAKIQEVEALTQKAWKAEYQEEEQRVY